MKKVFVLLIAVAALAIGVYTFAQQRGGHGTAREAHHADNGAKTASFDKKKRSVSAANSLWLVVNKRRPIVPKDYTPAPLVAPDMPLRLSATTPEMLLRKDAADALAALAANAKKDNIGLMLSSGYRSYSYQTNLYSYYVSKQGQAEADTQSARPGFSEHQTGLAADVEPTSRQCEVEQCFADLPEGRWVAANAYRYGFVIRYQNSKDAVTGYEYEPWHLRYVGTDLSYELHKQGNPTLEAFFALGDAPDYK
jgi:zinc D-Ala-D-Ala carboxypeptidase